MPGWSKPTKGLRRFADLPDAARRYVARLEEVSGVPAAIISTGSERDDTIVREDIVKLRIAELTI
jgi:adenylosuccinate synthase